MTLGLLRRVWKDFGEDDCPRMAASMSYFTVFSLAPLLVLLLLVLGVFLDPADVRGHIHAQLAALIGPDGARQIDAMIVAADRPTNRGVVPTALGALALFFGATGAFGELQSALNKVWEVKPDPRRGGVTSFLLKRILSLGMVATIAFLLLVSLVISAALSAFGDRLGALLGGMSGTLVSALNLLVSLVVVCGLFTAMFKVLPDAKIAWRDALVGSAFTSALFVAGKYLIGFYLSKSNPGNTFGAAGALAVILVWVYYSAMILFLGAEFTQAWATEQGRWPRPAEGAVPADAGDERDLGTRPRSPRIVTGPVRSRSRKSTADGASYS